MKRDLMLRTNSDELINTIMHELRTPLTSIKGFSTLLNHEEVIENRVIRDQYLKILERNVERLCWAVQNLNLTLKKELGAGYNEENNNDRG